MATKDEQQEYKDFERLFLEGEAEIGQQVQPEKILDYEEIKDIPLVTEVEVKQGIVSRILNIFKGRDEDDNRSDR